MGAEMADDRELREVLEQAQAEVKRLNAELKTARDGAAKKPRRDPEKLIAQLEQSRRELEQHWSDRERQWQSRERALRDEIDELKSTLMGTKQSLLVARQKTRQLEKAKAPSKSVLESLRAVLPSTKLKDQLAEARREIAQLTRKLSLQQLPRRR